MTSATGTYQSAVNRGLDWVAFGWAPKAGGWDVSILPDSPGTVDWTRQHPDTKLLAFVAGSMDVRVWRPADHCAIGDKLVIPGPVEHDALVGADGYTLFWSEQLGKPTP